jgi:hypothetical protein
MDAWQSEPAGLPATLPPALPFDGAGAFRKGDEIGLRAS